jgi:hypothetical protein
MLANTTLVSIQPPPLFFAMMRCEPTHSLDGGKLEYSYGIDSSALLPRTSQDHSRSFGGSRSMMNREELTRQIQEINAELYRITEELKALEERGAGGPMVAALKERLTAIERQQSEIARETERLMGERQ